MPRLSSGEKRLGCGCLVVVLLVAIVAAALFLIPGAPLNQLLKRPTPTPTPRPAVSFRQFVGDRLAGPQVLAQFTPAEAEEVSIGKVSVVLAKPATGVSLTVSRFAEKPP